MKGYVVESGYMGLIEGSYLLFADETDYEEAYYESQMPFMQNILTNSSCPGLCQIVFHNLNLERLNSFHVVRCTSSTQPVNTKKNLVMEYLFHNQGSFSIYH